MRTTRFDRCALVSRACSSTNADAGMALRYHFVVAFSLYPGQTSAMANLGDAPRQATPDILAPGLEALFVGANPGLVSAREGHNFANPGNAFWKLMHESGIVPQRILPADEMDLLRYGIGLTNLVARPTRGVMDLGPNDYAHGRTELDKKIRRYEPQRVVFVGITVCRHFFAKKPSAPMACGEYTERIHGARVFVVPNPSGRNAHFSYAEMLEAFQVVAKALGRV